MEDTTNPVARAEMEAREAQVAETPGRKEFFEEKGGGLDDGMTPKELTDAGWSYIYHRATGLRSKVNNNGLQWKLRHKDALGNYIWSATPPEVEPRQGTYKCLLHPDDPNREEYDRLGFNTCRKSNLASLFQVRRHMQKRHKVEFEAIEQAQKDAERSEDRASQKAMMDAIAGMSAPQEPRAPLYVSDKDAAEGEPVKLRRQRADKA